MTQIYPTFALIKIIHVPIGFTNNAKKFTFFCENQIKIGIVKSVTFNEKEDGTTGAVIEFSAISFARTTFIDDNDDSTKDTDIKNTHTFTTPLNFWHHMVERKVVRLKATPYDYLLFAYRYLTANAHSTIRTLYLTIPITLRHQKCQKQEPVEKKQEQQKQFEEQKPEKKEEQQNQHEEQEKQIEEQEKQ